MLNIPPNFFQLNEKILILLKHTQTPSLQVTKNTCILTETIYLQVSSTPAMKRLCSQEGFVNFRRHSILSHTLQPNKFQVLSPGVWKALQSHSSSLFRTRTPTTQENTVKQGQKQGQGEVLPRDLLPFFQAKLLQKCTQKCICNNTIPWFHMHPHKIIIYEIKDIRYSSLAVLRAEPAQVFLIS